MMNKKHLIYVAVLSLTTFLWSCKDNWEMHNEVQNVDYNTTLTEKLAAQTDLSVFNGYVKSSGYDQLLASSQNYTVWAPTNAALANLDQAIVADPVKLKDFVANHIALSTVSISTKANDTLSVKLLNQKYATIIGRKFEEGNIIGDGKFVKNGVLHVLDQPVPTKQNIWDYMLASTDAPLQSNFIKNLSVSVIDTANAVIIGYTSIGTPIFAPNPPIVARNTYWVNVADLREERQKYTFFMLQDGAFNAEKSKLASYYPSTNPNYSASFFLSRDLTVKGAYELGQLPDTLLSVNGVKVPINKNNVVKSYHASNGIVHVMSALPFRLTDKVPTFKIQGELPFGFSATRTVLFRNKLTPLGESYKDISVWGHRVAEFSIFYKKLNLPVVKYKVYARAVAGLQGDAQTVAFTQRYFILNNATATYNLFYTHLVNPLIFTETYMGEYTPQDFGTLDLRLTAANSTSDNVNTLILDYLRFEPVLP